MNIATQEDKLLYHPDENEVEMCERCTDAPALKNEALCENCLDYFHRIEADIETFARMLELKQEEHRSFTGRRKVV